MGRLPSSCRDSEQNFEQLTEKSVGNSALSLELKKSEVATRDIVNPRTNKQPEGKNSLATSLIEFLDDAKKTDRLSQIVLKDRGRS